jgi:serine/threonine protein phosphatase PrpC
VTFESSTLADSTYVAAIPFRYSARSDRGKKRQRNEDSYLAVVQNNRAIFAVADGVGGGDYGEEASSLALREFQRALDREPKLNKDSCKRAVRHAHKAVQRLKVERSAHNGVATTLTAIVIDTTVAYLIHVGDSRAYLVHQGEPFIEAITSDHTIVQEMLTLGVLDEASAQMHPAQHVLTQAVGSDGLLKIDCIKLDIKVLYQSKILLVTDGVTALASEEELSSWFASGQKGLSLDRIVSILNERGSPDNFTFIVAEAYAPYVYKSGIVKSSGIKPQRIFSRLLQYFSEDNEVKINQQNLYLNSSELCLSDVGRLRFSPISLETVSQIINQYQYVALILITVMCGVLLGFAFVR